VIASVNSFLGVQLCLNEHFVSTLDLNLHYPLAARLVFGVLLEKVTLALDKQFGTQIEKEATVLKFEYEISPDSCTQIC
jgi:hypothetical protein